MRFSEIADYELIDCGNGLRLERFAGATIVRPAPGALWPQKLSREEWDKATVHCERRADRSAEWVNAGSLPDAWQVGVGAVIVELKAAAGGQVGIFPEQLDNWCWVAERFEAVTRPVRVLNAFGYTGVATLVAAAASELVEVCHVDGSKSSVAWARCNAEMSGLSERPVRWIVDDVVGFLEREVRRGRKYDAFILDPPAFGRGGKGSWKLERDLPQLLQLVAKLSSKELEFVVLSCHSAELRSEDLAKMLKAEVGAKNMKVQTARLSITAEHGNDLPLGSCVRLGR